MGALGKVTATLHNQGKLVCVFHDKNGKKADIMKDAVSFARVGPYRNNLDGMSWRYEE
jgi:hypothetical protein